MLWALQLEYDGTPFMGWQRQAHGPSVQQALEEAAAKLSGGIAPTSIVAGRTDAGVHALAQVAQLDLPPLAPHRLVEALNYHLKPHPIVVLKAVAAPDGWNARFSASSRHYRYIISNRQPPPALRTGRVWHVKRQLDVQAMGRAAKSLLGNHDFSSFRAAACQAKSPVRTLDRLDVHAEAGDVIVEAGARSFLHHQVRNMVGSLKLVGEAAWPEARIADALAARDRAAAGPTAPACGLYLVRVGYDPDPFATSPAADT